jgi:hypothetical protein
MGWNVREVKARHNRWLAAYDASMARTMGDIGASAVHFARTDSTLRVRGGGYRAGWMRTYKRTMNRITASLLGMRAHNLFHEVGTGIYGPKKRRIVPRNKQFLVWRDLDSGQWRFARSVKGVKPTWNGRRSAAKAFLYGKGKLLREAERLAAKF